ncbi:60S ribosomal protein L29-like [Octodon degus]|uniref:60S ribosomal protein L29-like n=1 Tax=Octodon degus TaxID=10160 RepID=A0A6P6EM28_OCTDE|nr:60S ribosomal protein L29-like [Octodon degus]
MYFAKKHNKKGFKKMQANSAKAMSACAEAIRALVKPKEVKPKVIPKGVDHKITRLAYIAHPKFGKRICARIAKDPKAKTPASAPAQVPKAAQAPMKAPQ